MTNRQLLYIQKGYVSASVYNYLQLYTLSVYYRKLDVFNLYHKISIALVTIWELFEADRSKRHGTWIPETLGALWRSGSKLGALWRSGSKLGALWRSVSKLGALWRSGSKLGALWRSGSKLGALWRSGSKLDALWRSGSKC